MARTKRTRPIPKSHQPPLKKKSAGGMLVGPSHEQGGIPALVDGTEPIEVEGGEFVVNAKTVESVGENFLHKLNSTSTPYHDPSLGFNQGQLPSPSLFKKGGITDPPDKQHGLFRDEKLENPVDLVDYTLSNQPINKRFNRGKNVNNRKRRGGVVKKLQDGGNVVQNYSTVLPAHTAYERKKPCPLGELKNKEGVCFKLGGQPYETNKIQGRQILGGATGFIGGASATTPGFGAKMSHFKPSIGSGAAHFQSSNTLGYKGKGQYGGSAGNIADSLATKTVKTPTNQDKVNSKRLPTEHNQGKKSHNHKRIEDIYGNGHTTDGPGHEHLIQEGRILITCPEKGRCHSH